MRIAVTGASGFVGRNLKVRLAELGYQDVIDVPYEANAATLRQLLDGTDFVYHLAGVNRPPEPSAFVQGNHGFTAVLCQALAGLATPPRVAYSSSTQAALDNAYGLSKRAAEAELQNYAARTGAVIYLYRLPNVFGKWSRPNYNSVVATFCHNIARGIPLIVHDAAAKVRLVYIDDVVAHFCSLLQESPRSGFCEVTPEHETTVGALAAAIKSFRCSRQTLLTDRVGEGLTRALYATYVSFLPPEHFHYDVPRHEDTRGVFVEMLKTPDSGQFSYFTAHPGITRGDHYHHTKTEKFLVIKGTALFGFRHLVTGELHEITVEGGKGRIVETVPGWTHNITNTGTDELVVMLWANEIFDRQQPDTIARKVKA